MGRRIWLLLFTAAALAVCLPVLLLQLPPQGSAGSVDLSAWDFAHSGPVALASGWRFHPAEQATSGSSGSFLPSRKGTYRLVLHTSPQDPKISLYLDGASDFRLYVNGTLLPSSGRVTPLPEVVSLTPRAGTTVLRIQTLGEGSFSRPPVLGLPGQIDRLALLTLLWQAVLVGGFLLLGIYQFAVFLGGREDRASLYLVLVCAAAALHTAMGGSDLPSVFLPWLHTAWRVRLEMLGGYAAVFAGLRFLEHAFREQLPETARRAAAVVVGAVAVFSIVIAPKELYWLETLFYVLLVAYFVLTGLVAWRGIQRDVDGSTLLLVGIGALATTGLHDALAVARGLLPMWLAPGGLAVLVGTQALWLSQRTASRLRRETALSRENERLLVRADRQLRELRTSRTLLLELEEGVRREIAEMLHSRIQTRLLLVWHRLGDVEQMLESMPRKAKSVLASIRADLDAVRERDIRAASHRLHPSVIELGLLPALRSVADSYADRFQVRVRADRSVTSLDRSAEDRLPMQLRLCLYRAVEEALQNADRHGRASRVAIYLRQRDGRIRLRVRDDGVGVRPDEVTPGLGLRSVAARVALHDGTWRVLGAPGEGTTLEIELPLQQTSVGGGHHGTTARHPG